MSFGIFQMTGGMVLCNAEYTELGMFDTDISLIARQIAQLNEELMVDHKKELSIKLSLSGLLEKTSQTEICLGAGDDDYYQQWAPETFRYVCLIIIQ